MRATALVHLRATASLHVRTSAVLRATLAVPPLCDEPVGAYKLTSALRETRSWSNEFVGSLGCDLRAASAPSQISAEYGRVEVEKLPRSVQALLRSDPDDGVVKNIKKCLLALEYQKKEAGVDDYVQELLRGCDLDDGVATKLLPQETLRFDLGSLRVKSKPDHLLRCGMEIDGPNGMVDVVTQESKLPSPKGLAWGQVVGEMIAAALTNRRDEPHIPPPPVFGIRVVGTRWTFMRADFSKEYLRRLRSYTLNPDDRFQVWVWGGTSAAWGLDYNDTAEREDLMRMVVALGREGRKLVQSKGEVKAEGTPAGVAA